VSTGNVSFLANGPTKALGKIQGSRTGRYRNHSNQTTSNLVQARAIAASRSSTIAKRESWKNSQKKKLSQYEVLRSDQDALRHRFISAELDLALTFVRISQSTGDEERSERNLDHARKAVEVARKYLGETNLTATMREELVEKLQKLDPLVASGNRGSKAK
jgi:hypothetical protein